MGLEQFYYEEVWPLLVTERFVLQKACCGGLIFDDSLLPARYAPGVYVLDKADNVVLLRKSTDGYQIPLSDGSPGLCLVRLLAP